MSARTAILLNALGLYAVTLILLLGLVFQLVLHELPCPLCLLQRAAFAALAVGPILNLRFGPRPSHYATSLLAAAVGFVISARQVLLHIIPGDPGYGSAVLGLHYYSWAAIIFALAVVLIGIVLLFDRQFEAGAAEPRLSAFATVAVWAIIIVVAANGAAALLECGFNWCADNPTRYELLIGR